MTTSDKALAMLERLLTVLGFLLAFGAITVAVLTFSEW
jgi:hypothetical protein